MSNAFENGSGNVALFYNGCLQREKEWNILSVAICAFRKNATWLEFKAEFFLSCFSDEPLDKNRFCGLKSVVHKQRSPYTDMQARTLFCLTQVQGIWGGLAHVRKCVFQLQAYERPRTTDLLTKPSRCWWAPSILWHQCKLTAVYKWKRKHRAVTTDLFLSLTSADIVLQAVCIMKH